MNIKTLAGLLLLGSANASIVVSLTSGSGVTLSYNVNPDGSCFSLNGGTLAQFNDNLAKMDIPSGYECVIWQNYNCNGYHTDAFSGDATIADVCQSYYRNWANEASSFKCCAITDSGSWCAGSVPQCT